MEFLILGPLEVRNGEQTVRLGAAKQRALLGVLLLHANETVSSARLVDELWGERPPATAENLVQGYVHALRKQLGDGVVETQAPGYRLHVDPGSLDLLEFERLTEEARGAPVADAVELRRRALALWRGPALADVALEGPERHNVGRLGELRLTTQIERLEAELQLVRHAQVLGELTALVAEHPYQERAAALLMLALYRSGRQVEALEVYRTVRGRLSDELGLQAGKELRDLEAAILRQDDALAEPMTVPEPTVAGAAPAEAESPSAPTPRRRRRVALGAVLALLAAAGVTAAALLLRDERAPLVAPPNSVAVIDAHTNQVERVIQLDTRPGPVAAGAEFVWVGNPDDQSLTRIDPATSERERVDLDVTPDAVTADDIAAWVLNGRLGMLYRVDAESGISSDPIRLWDRSRRPGVGAGLAVGKGSGWAAFGDATLARVDPETRAFEAHPSAPTAPRALVVEFGYLWVVVQTAEVQQFGLENWDLGPVDSKTVGRDPSGIAAGRGAIWVACREDNRVDRIAADLNFGSSTPITVGDGPTAVTFGAGAVWVANAGDGTVTRIDPEPPYETTTIEVGSAPAGIAVYDGRVWVSVQKPFSS